MNLSLTQVTQADLTTREHHCTLSYLYQLTFSKNGQEMIVNLKKNRSCNMSECENHQEKNRIWTYNVLQNI